MLCSRVEVSQFRDAELVDVFVMCADIIDNWDIDQNIFNEFVLFQRKFSVYIYRLLFSLI